MYMSSNSVTIGIANSDMNFVKSELEHLLEIKFVEHESSYKGIYFLCQLPEFQEIELGNNFEDGDWREEKYKEYTLLLKLIGLNNVLELTNKVLRNINNSVFIKALETKYGEYLKVYDFVDGQFVLIKEVSLKKRNRQTMENGSYY